MFFISLFFIIFLFAIVGIFTKPDSKSLRPFFKKYFKNIIQDQFRPSGIVERFGCRVAASIVNKTAHTRIDDYFAYKIGTCIIPDTNITVTFIGIFNAWHHLETYNPRQKYK